MNPRKMLVIAVATAAPTLAAFAQPSGLQIAGITPGAGCPQGTAISPLNYGRISIEFQDKLAAAPNQGRIQCTFQVLVNVPAQYQFTFADYKGSNAPSVPLQAADVMVGGRLNGSTSNALVDLSWTIPAATAVTLKQSVTYSGGGRVWQAGSTLGNVVLPAGTVFPFSACAAQATTRPVTITINAAAASNYVLSWPPPAIDQNEKFYVSGVRFSAKWQACTP